jgi:hypothetical protein
MAGVLASSVWIAFRPAAFVDPVQWGPSWPVTTEALFQVKPRPGVTLMDEEVYLGTLVGVRAGEGFYEAQNDMFNANAGRWNTYSPSTYRQPLLTFAWVLLRSGAVIGIVFGVLSAVAMMAAYFAARVLVSPLQALLAPIATGLVFALSILHPPRILYSEAWAAPLLVTAGALCALALDSTRSQPNARAWGWSALGAAAALLALTVRELALIPIAGMILALWVDPVARRRGAWAPWIAAAAAWAGLYSIHSHWVHKVAKGDPPPPISEGTLLSSYFLHDVNFFLACLRWESTAPLFAPLLALASVFAVAGAWTVRPAGLGTLAIASTAGVIGLLLLFGTPGTFDGGWYTGYWGFLFLPVVLAWAPAGFRLFPRRAR